MTAGPLRKITSQTIQPFQVRQALTGLDFDSTNEVLLKYINFLSGMVPFEAIHFLHVLPKYNLFNLYREEEVSTIENELLPDNDIISKLNLQINTFLTNRDRYKVKTQVREGDPLEELLETADKIKSDLVIIGQSTDRNHHGILAKNFARQVWSNALLVPDKARISLKKILVPVDFSPNSAEALRAAVALNKSLDKPASITVLHNYQLPANFSAYRFNQAKVLEMLEEDRENALKDFLQEHIPDEDRHLLKPVLLKHNHFSVGQHIESFAENHKFDLIVMGAKGHSKVALLLLGSVTEKVLALTKRVPVLIVR